MWFETITNNLERVIYKRNFQACFGTFTINKYIYVYSFFLHFFAKWKNEVCIVIQTPIISKGTFTNLTYYPIQTNIHTQTN